MGLQFNRELKTGAKSEIEFVLLQSTMDMMLKKAGLPHQDSELSGPTQVWRYLFCLVHCCGSLHTGCCTGPQSPGPGEAGAANLQHMFP